MDFMHNYQSLAMNFVTVPAHNTDFVKNCRFDSDPALLKAPYKATGSDYWFSQQHVSLRGDAGLLTFAANSLQHAMLGIALLKDGLPVLKVDSCQFGELYLAGIVFNDDYHPDPNARLTVQNSHFTFPAGTALPPTSQVALTVGSSFTLNTNETVGLAPLFMPTVVTNTVFEQPSTALYNTFHYTDYRPRQVGIASHKLTQAFDNTFQGLAIGIAHRLRDGDTNTEVRGNGFTACEKGYDLVPVEPASNPATPTGTAYLSCNSFVRGVNAATRSGVSYGIYNESYSKVTLANPAPGGDLILKNLFDDMGTGTAGFYALYNANSSTSLTYYSYNNYSQQLLPLTNAPRVQLSGIGPAPNYVNGTACVGISLNGLQRTAVPTTGSPATADAPQLEQNAPNPTQGTASIAYHVPKGAQTASLLVRRGLDGRLMTSLPVGVAASHCEMKLAGYPAGTYFYTLVVDGLPVATRRLVVE
ncbi:hypothetical protein [Hymenobacter terricola]|uniref:hypothetical protein n=1 Tax=Hymenobacter terricola TaxID=2819236 RepID=UPI001B307112|nr:hypothetical protein [Hymenobacter terricola]